MTYADRRRPPPRRPPPYRGRRRRRVWPAVLALLVLAALAFLLFEDRVWQQIAGSSSGPSETVAEPVDVTIEEVLDRAVDNGDGTMTVTITEAEAGGLVRDGLQRGGTTDLRDITVNLMNPDGSAPGQMELNGRLRDQNVPVTAIVDLRVRDGDLEPSVRDVRLGPLPVPGAMRDDLDQQLRAISLLGAERIRVERLRTTDQELTVTGRRR